MDDDTRKNRSVSRLSNYSVRVKEAKRISTENSFMLDRLL
jgi:hypothetical protein